MDLHSTVAITTLLHEIPVTQATTAGVGYVNPAYVPGSNGVGFLAEADVEAGMRILPWFQLSIYAGMQVIGGFGLPAIVETALYTPVVGARFTWGSF